MLVIQYNNFLYSIIQQERTFQCFLKNSAIWEPDFSGPDTLLRYPGTQKLIGFKETGQCQLQKDENALQLWELELLPVTLGICNTSTGATPTAVPVQKTSSASSSSSIGLERSSTCPNSERM